jgi:hypothetical protein
MTLLPEWAGHTGGGDQARGVRQQRAQWTAARGANGLLLIGTPSRADT